MYYYIFDPPAGANEYDRVAKIKERLSSLGIAGEMTTPQPGRSIPELIQNALAKRYATIVAVGGVSLVNQVARAIAPHDLVFGIIPLAENHDLFNLINVTSWEAAAEQLKRRRWVHTQLGVINQEVFFLTPATIQLPRGTTLTAETKDFELTDASCAHVAVTPAEQLTITLTPHEQKSGGMFSGLLRKKVEPPRVSSFTATEVGIRTATPLPVIVAGSEICQTPITCSTESHKIRLIVGRVD